MQGGDTMEVIMIALAVIVYGAIIPLIAVFILARIHSENPISFKHLDADKESAKKAKKK